MNRAAPRRALVMVVAGLALAACTAAPPVITPWPPPSASAASAVPTGSPAEVFPLAFAGLELTFDARLEVFAVDTGSGRAVSYRSDERFGYASTFKALAAAILTSRSEKDAGYDDKLIAQAAAMTIRTLRPGGQ